MESTLINTFKVSEANAMLFLSSFEKRTLAKGEKFLAHGRVSSKVGFVEEGLLKCVLINGDKTMVDDFVFEGQFVANYHSFLKQEASNKDIVCMKKSVIRTITKHKLDELAKEHSFVADVARQVAENLFIDTYQKLEDIRILNAEERYLKLVGVNKRIVNEIPQYEIASYLNVSPETVSRVRSKLASRS